MHLKSNVSLFSLTGLKHILFSASAHFLFLALTHFTLIQLPWLQFRFASFVPMICGIMFGLPGAVGSMLGNLLADRITNTELSLSIAGSLINFFSAYLPYRLWYGLNGKRALRFIYDSSSFARYIIITALTSFFVASSLTAVLEFYFNTWTGHNFTFFTIFSNDYDFPVLLGLPILIFICRRAETIYYPPARQEKAFGGMQIPALKLLVLVDIGFLLFSQNAITTKAFSLGVFILNLLLLTYICTLPSECEPLSEDNTATTSLVGATTGLLLLFISGFIVLTLVALLLFTDNISVFFATLQKMNRFYLFLTLTITGSFLIFYYLLRWLEQNISFPLTNLSKRARHYMETGTDKVSEQQIAPAKNEIQELDQHFSKMTREIKQYVTDLTAATEEKHAILAQLEVAAQIQQGTLPNLAEVNASLQAKKNGYIIKAGMLSAKLVGGDMYDCYLLDPEKLFFCVGDVSGKGIPASLFAVLAQTLLSNCINSDLTADTHLADIVKKVNITLAENNPEVLFVTLWVGILDLSTGTLNYVNAGHNPPLIASNNGTGQVQPLEEISGPVLGLMPKISYTSYTAILPPCHKLLIFTDGLNEAENNEQEFYGNERLQKIFLQAQSPEEIITDINLFTADAPPSDDKTYLWIERV